MHTYEDYIKPASDLMDKIQSQGYDISKVQADPNTGQIYKLGSKGEYIKDEDVSRVANANIDSFLSGEGNRWFTSELFGTDIDYTNLSDDYKKIARAKAFNLMKGLGEKQKFVKSGSEQGLTYMPEYAMGLDEQGNPKIPSFTTAQSDIRTEENPYKKYLTDSGELNVDQLLEDTKNTTNKDLNRNAVIGIGQMAELLYPGSGMMKKSIVLAKERYGIPETTTNKVMGDLLTVAVKNGLSDKDPKKSMANAIKFMEYHRTNTFKDIVPDKDIANAMTEKFIDKGQIDLNKSTIIGDKEYNTLGDMLQKINGDLPKSQRVKPLVSKIDFNSDNSNGGQASIVWNVGGKEVRTKIDNNDYNSFLKPLARLSQQSYNSIVDNENKIKSNEIIRSSEILNNFAIGSGANSDLIKQIAPNIIGYTQLPNGSEIVNFKDPSNSTSIKTIVYDPKSNTITPYMDFNTFMKSETPKLFTLGETADIRRELSKTKKTDYSTE